MNPTAEIVNIARWVRELHYNDIRRAECLQLVPVFRDRKKKRPLRAVQVAPDLWLARDKKFYRVIDNRALVVPLVLVASQYNLTKLRAGYAAAIKEQRKLRRA